ncbi:MAG: YeeE/YedE family protein [Gammaproteobacteria bacterium]|nr:YeeE/YedE family protein [Gammaproteobacteria bacterium]
MNEYWSWWLGALGLGGFCILYFTLMGNLLGVSASWRKVVNWRKEQELDAEISQFDEDVTGISDALMAETLAEFGDLAEQNSVSQTHSQNVVNSSTPLPSNIPWTAHMAFLLCMTIGGFLAAITTGSFKIEFTLSQVHSQIFGSNIEVWLSMLFGGIMVGFGTQMAGGCTSGHGLSGCSRLIPASLISTCVFMGSAILLSLLMESTLR